MKNNIFIKISSIIFFVFISYLVLLFLYDFYFYKHLYIKICSIFYCFEFIEFKDYASILATLIGSAFVAYSLFSWADNFKYNLKKGDIDRFRMTTHNFMKTINIIHGEYKDIYSFIINSESLKVDSSKFENLVVNFKGNLDELNILTFKFSQQYHEFIFDSRYYQLHGGNLDLVSLKDKYKKLMEVTGFLLSDLHNNEVQEFKIQIPEFESLYNEFDSELSRILDKTYEILLS
ncbi:hypothetical protein ODQ17_05160 [Acinetobacter sp. IRS14]|uniref:hypothetical protein n=1 Tax=Acinetobacter sp. IRS14 TaxID=2983398 RepID=UPI002AFE7EA8|nr:hypothetical protein [Acinetobacter sp. IRS14]MEA1228745.1 hypothetical protein [Acinetobacter sp. IRS14]